MAAGRAEVTSPFMAQALAAARAAEGFTSPNPWVGAVLVRDGRVLAVGATAPPGGPHAEAAALALAPGDGGELYVTLEPCVPFPGKRTPACVETIIESGVRRVIIALPDPDPRVQGRGIAALRQAGIDVEVGDGAEEAAELLRPYLKHRERGLPYVYVKFAASLDGRTATRTGDSRWITGEEARERAHRLRARVDAVLVGANTVIADDPQLTARPGGEPAERQPLRVVVDAAGRVSPGSKLFRARGPVLVVTTPAARRDWRDEIQRTGAELLECPSSPQGVALEAMLRALAERGVLSVWAEGGSRLLGSLLAGGLADELWAFLAPIVLGSDGLPALELAGPERVEDAWRLRNVAVERLGEDVLVRGRIGDWEPETLRRALSLAGPVR